MKKALLIFSLGILLTLTILFMPHFKGALAVTPSPSSVNPGTEATNIMPADKPASDAPKTPEQVTVAVSKPANTLKAMLAGKEVTNPKGRIAILVDKSEHTLSVLLDGQPLKTYHVELGDGGSGDKNVSGDHKTPEGTFYVSEKSVLEPADEYLGSRWMRLSYPNIEDAQRGLNTGLISKEIYQEIITAFNHKETPPQRTALGGGVGIHGGSTSELGSDWTWGCVGLSNKDVEEIYDYVSIGTPVTIQR